MPRPFTSGSLADAEGGIRAYLHIKRLRKIAASVDVHCRHAEALRTAADAMELLSARNRRVGRELGALLGKRVLTTKGASLRADCPETPATIADLAADAPVTVYIHRAPNRIRVTTQDRLPRAAKVVGRYDAGSDYRRITQDIQEALCAT